MAKGPTLEIAPLTVTANPKQTISLGWTWREDWWHDEATGWSGVWAMNVSAITGRAEAVRVRIMDDWPLLTSHEFYSVLCAAKYGRRPASVADNERMGVELAAAPIAPAEGIGSTVTAQLAAIMGEQ